MNDALIEQIRTAHASARQALDGLQAKRDRANAACAWLSENCLDSTAHQRASNEIDAMHDKINDMEKVVAKLDDAMDWLTAKPAILPMRAAA